MKYRVEDCPAAACEPVADAKSAAAALRAVCLNCPSVRSAALFGSFARGEQTPSSDVDVLVLFDPETSSGTRYELGESLASGMGRDVDCLTSLEGASRRFVDSVKADGRLVYAR